MRRNAWKTGRGTGIATLAAFLLLLPAASIRAGGEEEKKESEEKTRTYTNEDLEESDPGEAGEVPVSPSVDPPDDPLRPYRNAEQARQWRQKRLQQARKEIAAIEQQIEYWKARRLSIRNPLYPRPAVPEAVEEGENPDEEQGLDGPALVERVNERLEALERRLEEARQRLVEMERQFHEADLKPPQTGEKSSPPPRPL